jgi:polyhydroxyalkanoate synthase subunit PhaC
MNALTSLVSLFFRRAPVGKTPAEVVVRENKWRLLRYRAREEGRAFATPIVIVPSLINRSYVLDLLPGRSFVEYLVRRGHDVFMIDWGTPEAEDRYLDFDTICDRYLGRALRAALREARRPRAHVLGYCLGGTLAAIHTAVHPERVASLTALAAPISFHDQGLLSIWSRTKSFDIGAIVDAFGNIPWPLMQASFELLKPTLNAQKGVQLLERAWDDEFLEAFHAIETWGHDNVSFPGECYRRYIEELYRGDALVNGEMYLSGKPAKLSAIRCPTLAVTFEHDHIVPKESAAVLLDLVGAEVKERIHLPGGHVGAVVSKKASSTLWPALSNFWAKNEPAAQVVPVSPRAAREPTA